MIEFYPQIKAVHVAAVLLSGGLFFIRGLAVQAGGRWAMAAPLRYTSYGIDTVLLVAALLLLTVLPYAAYENGWLALKVALLVVYIVLGSFALKRGRTAGVRLATFVTALLVYVSMYLIARAHHPLGPLKMLQASLS